MGEDGQYVVDVYCERLPVWYRRTTYERVAQVSKWGRGLGMGFETCSRQSGCIKGGGERERDIMDRHHSREAC
jgi:hypothetical protein